jgi:hypothetical protein
MRYWYGVLALLAVSAAVGGAVIASAAGPPEFKNREGGEVVKKKFKLKTKAGSESPKLYVKGAGVKITCSGGEKGSGEITGAKTVGKVTIVYSACTAEKEGQSCGEAKGAMAQNPGEIRIAAMKGRLGKVEGSEAPSEVGQILESEKTSGGQIVEVVFGNENVCSKGTVSGKVVGEVPGPFNTPKLTGEVVYSVVEEEQKIKKFEGEEAALATFGVASADSSHEEVTFEEEVQVT